MRLDRAGTAPGTDLVPAESPRLGRRYDNSAPSPGGGV